LAAWLRGIEFIKESSNRNQVLQYMKEFYASFNVTISDQAMESEIDLRPILGLDEQIFNIRRENGEPSTVDRWYEGVSEFMFNAGVLMENVSVDSYITDKYMQMVANDTELRLFALRENKKSTGTSCSFSLTMGMSLIVTWWLVCHSYKEWG